MKRLDKFKVHLGKQEMSRIFAGTLRHTRTRILTIEVMDVWDDTNDNGVIDNGEHAIIVHV